MGPLLQNNPRKLWIYSYRSTGHEQPHIWEWVLNKKRKTPTKSNEPSHTEKCRFHLKTQFQDRKGALASFWQDHSSMHTLFRSLALRHEVFQQIQLNHCYGRHNNFFLLRKGWEIKQHRPVLWHGLRVGGRLYNWCPLCSLQRHLTSRAMGGHMLFHVLSGKLI